MKNGKRVLLFIDSMGAGGAQRQMAYLACLLMQRGYVVKIITYGDNSFYAPMYGAQNEAYMSRLAEKWVRGLCFNELGVGG